MSRHDSRPLVVHEPPRAFADLIPETTSSPEPRPQPVILFSEEQRGPIIPPIVPQKCYQPYTSSDRRHYVDQVNLEPRVDFNTSKIGESGIPWSCQIPAKDLHNPPVTVTRPKPEKNAATRFISEHQGRPTEGDGEPNRAVSTNKVEANDLVIVVLDPVSRGSWQARLRTLHPLHRS